MRAPNQINKIGGNPKRLSSGVDSKREPPALFASFTPVVRFAHAAGGGCIGRLFRQLPNDMTKKGLLLAASGVLIWHWQCCMRVSLADLLRGESLRMLTVRNAWSGLDRFEKVAVVLGVVALTLAAWALGTLAMP